MRHFLIPVLLLGLVAGCSSVKISPHRIDVQQGNALDQENVARLKPGLNRSQVRFLLGTPLVVDPFRTDRWDYVYVFYKAGKLAEQKRITLFFEGDTLVRIEGDVPDTVPAELSSPAAANTAPPARQESAPAPAPAPAAAPVPALTPAPAPVAAAAPDVSQPAPTVAPTAPVATPAAPVTTTPPPAVRAASVAPPAEAAPRASSTTSVVAPLPSPKDVPAYVDPRVRPELSLSPETDVTRIQPDTIPPFPEPYPQSPATASDAPVLKAVADWAAAWSRRDAAAYFAAYDASFVPPEGDTRAAWEARRRLLLAAAKNVELKVDAPVVQRMPEGDAIVTFNQQYRSDSYRDTVAKQLRLVERDGRWLIVEEKVLPTPRGKQP